MTIRRFLKAVAVVTSLFSMASVASVVTAPAAFAEQAAKQKIFLMVKADPKTETKDIMKALNWGRQLAERGHDVTTFLNGDGVKIADKRDPLTYSTGKGMKTVKEVLVAYMKSGAKFVVCPMCSAHAGIGKDDLRDGMKFAAPDTALVAIEEADKVLNF